MDTIVNDSTLVYIRRTTKNNSIVKEGVFKIPYWMYLMESEKYEGIEYIGINELEDLNKSDESINKEKNKVMKVYYFEVINKELEITDSKIKGFGKTIDNKKYKYVIGHGANQKEAYDSIINTFKIRDEGFGEFQNILNLEGKSKEGYILSSGGDEITRENINNLSIDYKDCLVVDTAMYDFSELWPKNIEPSKDENSREPVKKIIKNGLLKKKILSKISTKTGVKPLINAFSRLAKRISIKVMYQTTVDTITKYPSRLDPETNVWKPVVKPEIKQLPKSEKRLVCVATKDREVFQRIPYNEAEILIKNHLEYEFISKEEYRKSSRTFKKFNYLDNKYEKVTIPKKPGLSFTPDNIDKKYKRIPVEVVYTVQEEIRNPSGKITYKDTDETFTKWEHQLVYDDSADNKYHDYKKIPSKPSSSKKAKCLRKSNHCNQGVSGKKIFNTYEVSFFRNMKEGSAEFVYIAIAPNEWKAVNRASKKVVSEGADLAYYSPKVELKVKGNINTKVKGKSSYKRIILPLVTDLPIHKDKKGDIIPWTVKEFKFDPKTQKTELVNTEVKTFTGYQITYQKIESPFKKSPKKWKHPIKDGRNKVKVIKSKNNKTIIIKRK